VFLVTLVSAVFLSLTNT